MKCHSRFHKPRGNHDNCMKSSICVNPGKSTHIHVNNIIDTDDEGRKKQ